jgi:hypothetical protein|tara:strand:- start:1307 stop:1495 length:189 start_codon:yes stop_codon:yes gene_type:complete
MTTDMITHTMDIDPNISVFELFKTINFFGAKLISLNEQSSLPLPSISIEITKSNLDKLLTQI